MTSRGIKQIVKAVESGPPEMNVFDRARWREFKAICRSREWEWISDDLDVQERYLDMRLAGESHNMAEILASRKFPATRTDVEWNRGHCNGSQFAGSPAGEFLGNYYRSVAEEHGVNVTGKVYKSGLASFPGDPRAWVNSRGDAQAVIEERGWSSQGLVNVKARGNDLPEGAVVDPSLIAKEVAYREDQEEMLGCKDAGELTDKLTRLRGWKPDHEIGKETD